MIIARRIRLTSVEVVGKHQSPLHPTSLDGLNVDQDVSHSKAPYSSSENPLWPEEMATRNAFSALRKHASEMHPNEWNERLRMTERGYFLPSAAGLTRTVAHTVRYRTPREAGGPDADHSLMHEARSYELRFSKIWVKLYLYPTQSMI